MSMWPGARRGPRAVPCVTVTVALRGPAAIDSFDGMKRLTAEEDDMFGSLKKDKGPKGKKPKAEADPVKSPVTYSMETLKTFNLLKISPPVTRGDCASKLPMVEEKLAEFKSKQAAKIAKREAQRAAVPEAEAEPEAADEAVAEPEAEPVAEAQPQPEAAAEEPAKAEAEPAAAEEQAPAAEAPAAEAAAAAEAPAPATGGKKKRGKKGGAAAEKAAEEPAAEEAA